MNALLPAIGPARLAAARRYDRLRRLMHRASLSNASDQPAMISPPTLTMRGTTATSGLTVNPTYTANPELFTVYGGVPVGYFDRWKLRSVTRNVSGGNSGSVSNPGGGLNGLGDCISGRFAWMTDSPGFDIELGGSTAGYRLLVDGQYAAKAGALTTSGNTATNYWNVAAAGGARKLSRYDLEIEQDHAFRGIRLGVGDVIRPVSTAERYRIAVVGDSITASTGATRKGDGYAFHAARRLGNLEVDLVAMGLGGTGYLNPGTTWKFRDHLDDLLLQPIDEVWFCGGTNDTGYTSAALQAEALLCFQGARQRCPSAPIILLGSFVGGGNASATLTVEQALKAALDQFADPNSGYIPFQNVATGAKLQTGNSGAPTTGNYQYYGNGTTDTTHPVDAGHDYIGSAVATGRRGLAL